jgi:hypothetical protein
MNKMFDDILGERKEKHSCPDCNMDMERVEDHYVCPNGCWEYHDGKWKVGIGS